MNRLPISLFVLGAAALPAQSVTATITAPAPIIASYTAYGLTVSATQPAGPLTPGSIIAQATLSDYSSVGWYLPAGPGATQVGLSHDLSAGTPASAQVGPNEFLISFKATATVAGFLRVTSTAFLTANVPTPLVQIDVDNDGVFDFTALTNAPVAWPVTFGTQPKLVRVVMQSTLQGPGQVDNYVLVEAVPDIAADIYRSAIGCAVFDSAVAVPVFEDGGIDVHFVEPDPTVFVLGLSQQPMILPPNLGQTCLLLPSPDILGWNPEGVHHVALPAAVRPVTFSVQGVALTVTGLLPTDAYTVHAY